MKKLFLGALRFYQYTLSPDHSANGKLKFPNGYCKHIPSCSEYCCQAIEKYGTLKGLWKGARRVVRCNPVTPGGVDTP